MKEGKASEASEPEDWNVPCIIKVYKEQVIEVSEQNTEVSVCLLYLEGHMARF